MGDEKAMVVLRLPSTLSEYSGGKSQITLRADTVGELLALLEQQHPQVWQSLCTEHGQVREHISIFVNNARVTFPEGLKTPLKTGQEIIVLPASSNM